MEKFGFMQKQTFRLLILIPLLIIGCSRPEYKFEFNQKWTVLQAKNGDEKLNDNFISSPLLQSSIYPAIRFRSSDSTVLWPGFKKAINRFKFSVDRSFSKISFKKIDSIKYQESEFYMKLICETYHIKIDDHLGWLRLSTEDKNHELLLVPTERFVRESKNSELD